MKNAPKRMCVVCRDMKDKKELVRVVHSKDGETKIDLTGKVNGRGAYICKSKECLEQCKKRKCFERAFGVEVDSKFYDELREQIGATEVQ